MKQINLTDEDYDSLMELTKELQNQENDGQAHPYFWEPRSERYEQDALEEGEIQFGYDCSNYSPEELWDSEGGWESLKESFLELNNEYNEASKYTDVESDWIDFVSNDPEFYKWYRKLESQSEHNPSLFKSDVKSFIEGNKHHLGQNPHTYARTIWRMPKMINLVSILCRINKQENADDEIKRYCHN